jgi:uncharacterized protein YbjQ (UPF0145 family)
MKHMRISSLTHLEVGEVELGIVYASVEGVNEHDITECMHTITNKAKEMGAAGIIGLQLVQSNFQWSPRTTLMGTAVKGGSN